MAICSENKIEQVNTLYGQNVEFVSVKDIGIYIALYICIYCYIYIYIYIYIYWYTPMY
jgi:hypothetical protein